MNQIEIWFGILTRQAVRRGSFNSVKDLTDAIDRFTLEWNDRATPFTWIKTADQILSKATPKAKENSGAGH
jgi:hypothetical protein